MLWVAWQHRHRPHATDPRRRPLGRGPRYPRLRRERPAGLVARQEVSSRVWLALGGRLRRLGLDLPRHRPRRPDDSAVPDGVRPLPDRGRPALRLGDPARRPQRPADAPALALGRADRGADARGRERRRRLGRADARHRHRLADHRVGPALDGAPRPRLLRTAPRPRRSSSGSSSASPASACWSRPGGRSDVAGRGRARLQLARLGGRLAVLAAGAAARAGRSSASRCRCSPAG